MTEPSDLIITPPALPLHQLLPRVLTKLGAIEKNGTAPASMGGYKFRRVEDVADAARNAFAELGIIMVPRTVERIDTVRLTSGNKNLYCCDLLVEFTFYGPAGDTIVGSVWGEGTDSGDKATQKAVTAALKSMLTPTFLITDSADDSEAHTVEETTTSQRRNESVNQRDAPNDAPPAGPTQEEMEAEAREFGFASAEDRFAKHGELRPWLMAFKDAGDLTGEEASAIFGLRPVKTPGWMTTTQIEWWYEEATKAIEKHRAEKAGTPGA